MAGVGIEWKGVEKLTMIINGAGSKVREQSSKVVKNNTSKLKSLAQEKAPVAAKNGGFLKSQIKDSYPDDLQGRVVSGAGYAGYQEYGTRFQPGTPHMRPALHEIEPQFQKDMTDVMKGAFE